MELLGFQKRLSIFTLLLIIIGVDLTKKQIKEKTQERL